MPYDVYTLGPIFVLSSLTKGAIAYIPTITQTYQSLQDECYMNATQRHKLLHLDVISELSLEKGSIWSPSPGNLSLSLPFVLALGFPHDSGRHL